MYSGHYLERVSTRRTGQWDCWPVYRTVQWMATKIVYSSPRDTEFITGRTVHTSLFRMWTCSWVPESLDSWWEPNIIFLIPFLNTTTDKTIKSSWFSINHIRTIFFSSNPTTSPVSCPQRNVEKRMGISPRSSPNQTKVVVHNFFHN